MKKYFLKLLAIVIFAYFLFYLPENPNFSHVLAFDCDISQALCSIWKDFWKSTPTKPYAKLAAMEAEKELYRHYNLVHKSRFMIDKFLLDLENADYWRKTNEEKNKFLMSYQSYDPDISMKINIIQGVEKKLLSDKNNNWMYMLPHGLQATVMQEPTRDDLLKNEAFAIETLGLSTDEITPIALTEPGHIAAMRNIKAEDKGRMTSEVKDWLYTFILIDYANYRHKDENRFFTDEWVTLRNYADYIAMFNWGMMLQGSIEGKLAEDAAMRAAIKSQDKILTEGTFYQLYKSGLMQQREKIFIDIAKDKIIGGYYTFAPDELARYAAFKKYSDLSGEVRLDSLKSQFPKSKTITKLAYADLSKAEIDAFMPKYIGQTKGYYSYLARNRGTKTISDSEFQLIQDRTYFVHQNEDGMNIMENTRAFLWTPPFMNVKEEPMMILFGDKDIKRIIAGGDYVPLSLEYQNMIKSEFIIDHELGHIYLRKYNNYENVLIEGQIQPNPLMEAFNDFECALRAKEKGGTQAFNTVIFNEQLHSDYIPFVNELIDKYATVNNISFEKAQNKIMNIFWNTGGKDYFNSETGLAGITRSIYPSLEVQHLIWSSNLRESILFNKSLIYYLRKNNWEMLEKIIDNPKLVLKHPEIEFLVEFPGID